MLIRNNYEVPTSVCIDMAQLRFLFCLGGGRWLILRLETTTLMKMIVVMTMNHFCDDCQRKLLLREIHHAIILTIITDTIIPLPLEHH